MVLYSKCEINTLTVISGSVDEVYYLVSVFIHLVIQVKFCAVKLEESKRETIKWNFAEI